MPAKTKKNKRYDNRKQSVYLPKDMLDKIMRIKELQGISISRVIQDCFHLVETQHKKLDWDDDNELHLRYKPFKEAVK